MQNLRRRVVALILCFMLIASLLPLSALAEKHYRFKKGGNSFTVQVRVIAPGPKSHKGCLGHYDICIKGAAIRFRGKTFVNPCFSYSRSSRLIVFSEADTTKVYRPYSKGSYLYGCSMYKTNFHVRGRNKLESFLSAVNATIASSRKYSACSSALSCKLKSSSRFHRYKTKKVNCFLATAVWMKCFGKNKLMKMYSAAYKPGGRSYLPRDVVRRYKLKKK